MSAKRHNIQFGQFDGPADQADTGKEISGNMRNLDFGLQTFYQLRYGSTPPSVGVARSSKPNIAGSRQVTVRLNAYNVERIPSRQVFQFDVKVVFSDSSKVCDTRGILRKVWTSDAVKKELGPGFIYDGNKLAWGVKDLTRLKDLPVDLNAEEGRESSPKNRFLVTITKSTTIRFDSIDGYLQGKNDMDNDAISAITFLDHVLREGPSSRMTSIKRSFFAVQERETRSLGNGVEVMKGAYAAIKPVFNGSGRPSLAINVDISNGAFFESKMLPELVSALCGLRDLNEVTQALIRNDRRMWEAANKVKRLHVLTRHCKDQNGKNRIDSHVIENIEKTSARNMKITCEEKGQEVQRSVEDYFAKQYGIKLKYPTAYMLKMKGSSKRPTFLPMELCKPEMNARYPSKLNERQTAEMIKVAVTPPPQRWKDIQTQVAQLQWGSDKYLRNYDMKIADKPTTVTATLIPPPQVLFAGGKTASPGTSGRWDLRGQAFYRPGETLRNWSVSVARRGNRPDDGALKAFITNLVGIMKRHGVKVENERPRIVEIHLDNPEGAVISAIKAAGDPRNPPQLLMFVLLEKSANVYNALKHYCDIGPTLNDKVKMPGVASQMIHYDKVEKNSAQYCSNVATKINAKLGGITSVAKGAVQIPSGTMYIGCDVSHGAPGSNMQSIAAMTVSADTTATKYLACVRENGSRVEMVQPELIDGDLKELCQRWMQKVNQGKLPSTVFYMRDGVSEGQYPQVLAEEVNRIEAMIKTLGKGTVKICAMVCSKRHHVRFFPEGNAQSMDKNGNALPGTVVDTGVTDPRNFDFYLCAHAALKGTARPVHYYMLRDDTGIPPGKLQQMVYEHSYQYSRATTPISLHPAIYYAHQAAARATAHVPKHDLGMYRAGEMGSGGGGGGSSGTAGPATGLERMWPKLKETMWFI